MSGDRKPARRMTATACLRLAGRIHDRATSDPARLRECHEQLIALSATCELMAQTLFHSACDLRHPAAARAARVRAGQELCDAAVEIEGWADDLIERESE